MTRRALAALAAMVFVSCHASTREPNQPSPRPGAPTAATTTRAPADSLYATVRARLRERGYRVDKDDARGRRLVVRAPNDSTAVEVRVVARGDSSTVAVAPLGEGGLVAGLRAMLTVTHDATMASASEQAAEGARSGGVITSHWRPELFVSPGGRFWMATGGLYTADSLRGLWRRVLGSARDGVDADALRIGSSMAFVDESTALVGLETAARNTGRPVLYRTSDGGASWSPVNVGDVVDVDAMEAVGRSVWVFATRWEHEQRRGTLLRSADGGLTWERPPLPADLNDVTHLYRVSPTVAYVATAGYKGGTVFWRTTDGGDTWTPLPTPHDQGVHEVPKYGVRVEQIATVGDWLVVREYGKVFVSHPDPIQWRALPDVEHVAADRERDQLFVLTASLHAAMLDRELRPLWRTADSIPDARPTNVEQVRARDGVGYVSMTHGEIFEAREGVLRVVRPRS